MRASFLLLLAACGGGSTPPVVESGPPATMVAQSAGPGDVIVAQVAGRPVWGSCVAMQVQATPTKTKEVALAECIDFELLAQAAEQKGLDRHAETIDATRTALVTRLVDQFAARTTPDLLRTRIDELYTPATFALPERRESWHVLVQPTGADDAAAKALADQIYKALENQTGLLPAHLEEAAKRIAPGVKIEHYPAIAVDHRGTLPEYRGALFAIPEVGRVAPAKTKFGYHVILLAEISPSIALDREAAGPIIFANLQRRLFDEYMGEVLATTHTKAQQYPEVLDQLAKGAP